MASSDSYVIDILSNTITYMYRYGGPVIYIIGNVGNLLSAWIFLKKTWRKNVCVFYFLICLILNLGYLNSTAIATIFISGFNINLQNSSEILCKLFYYISFLTAVLPPNVLILASIDRLLISSQNVDTRLYSSRRLAYFSISTCTVFWIVFNFHILIKVNIQQLGPSTFVCYYDLSKAYIDFVSYYPVAFGLLYYFLMIILTIFAFKNVRQIKAVPRQQRNQIRSMTKKDFQLIRCLFIQDIVFIFLSTFLNVYAVYAAATRDQISTPLRQAIMNLLNDLFTCIFSFFYCSNFFVFISGSKAFRVELYRLICKMCGKEVRPIRENENKQENMELNVAVVINVVASEA